MLSSYDVSLNQNMNMLEEKLLSLNKDYQILFKLNFNNFGNTDLLLYKVDEYSANLIDIIINMRKDLVNDRFKRSYNKRKLSKINYRPNLLIFKIKKQFWKKRSQI